MNVASKHPGDTLSPEGHYQPLHYLEYAVCRPRPKVLGSNARVCEGDRMAHGDESICLRTRDHYELQQEIQSNHGRMEE